jgi:hypothetical protein
LLVNQTLLRLTLAAFSLCLDGYSRRTYS